MSEPIQDFYAVIPAGGIGSRLWPLSRADAPKFLHDLTGSGHSLLRDTWDRLEPLAGADRIAVVTGRAHRAAVESELPGIPDLNVFLESEPRESAAAIGLAAAILHRRDPDVIIGSFSADHVIRSTRVFEFAVRDAVEVAREGYICTIGISPTEPAVGFGYIRKGPELVVEGAREAALVESFVEKPDLETAKAYFADRGYLWNAGMFIAKASVLLEELAENEPALHAGLIELAEAWDDRERRVLRSTGSGRGSRRSRSTTPSPSRPPAGGASPWCRVTSTGTTSATSPPSRSSSTTGARTTSPSSGRRPACCRMRQAASSSARPLA